MFIFITSLSCTIIVGSINAILRIKQKQNRIWGIISLVLIIVGGLFSFVVFLNNSRRSEEMQRRLFRVDQDLEYAQRCSNEAKLDFYGGERIYGLGMYSTDILYNSLLGTYTENGIFNCGEEYEIKYKDTIKQFPKFPFAYYALALCKEKENDASWKGYAESAVDIFKCTTQIGGHKPTHDEAFSQLKFLLSR